MTIRSSSYFNNPAFAQAAQNLSSLFAPPSGADAAGWASANAKKEEAARLSQLFDYASDPNFNQTQFDRQNIAAGQYAPTSSFYSVDESNATARRGQDVTASTSRANNADDNARALETNRLTQLGGLFDPLSEGQIRPELPPEIASQFGAPGALPAAQGREKPLSEAEVKGKLILDLLSPNEQKAVAFGSTPTDEILTADGPKIVTRPDAIDQVPYDKPTGGLDIQFGDDGRPLSISQGGSGKPLTEAAAKGVKFVNTAEAMQPVLAEIGDELASLPQAASESIPLLGNYAQSEKYQRARLAGERFTQVVLRDESGAATPDAEIAKYMNTFLPKPGDKPGTIKFKTYLRHVGVESMRGGMSKEARIMQLDAAIATGAPPEFLADLAAEQASAPAAPAAPATAGPGRFERDASGKLIRVQ